MDDTTHPFAAWLALPPGYRFPDVPVTIDAARQRRDHDMVDVQDDLFAGKVNIGTLTDVITQAVHAARLPIDGRVLLGIEVEQVRPMPIGCPFISRGSITSLTEVRLGHQLTCAFTISRADDISLPLGYVRSEFLLMSKTPERSGPRPTAGAGAKELQVGYELVGRTALTPRKVSDYCADLGNLVHLDPAYARAKGYRAPVAPRLMDVTMIVGVLPLLWGQSVVEESFGIKLRVLRPVFWDNVLEVWAKTASDRIEFRCFCDDGRLVTEAIAWR